MKIISSITLDDTLTLVEYQYHGFWLYDKTRGMNLSMRAKTPELAYFETIKYYQRRLKEVEKQHKELSEKVNNFLKQFEEEQRDENEI